MAAADSPRSSADDGRLSVLVVDDDERFREYAAEPFRRRGDEVRATADGLKALAMCIERAPDIVLTDVQMPRMDGWQLLRLLRARPELASVPVVFLTSLNGDADRLRGYQLGVDAYIPKPYTPDELLVRVHRIVMRVKESLPSFTDRTNLRGELEHVAPSSLFSIMEVERKTGVLILMGQTVARVFFKEGRAIRAQIESEPQIGSRDVLMRVLDWNSGQFELSTEEVAEKDEVGKPVTALVLEYARLKDEGAR